jgi:hypothetical protein
MTSPPLLSSRFPRRNGFSDQKCIIDILTLNQAPSCQLRSQPRVNLELTLVRQRRSHQVSSDSPGSNLRCHSNISRRLGPLKFGESCARVLENHDGRAGQERSAAFLADRLQRRAETQHVSVNMLIM